MLLESRSKLFALTIERYPSPYPNTRPLLSPLKDTPLPIHDKTSLNISESQRKQKKVYDRKHQSTILSVNTMVLMKNSCQKQRKGGKMDDRYTGPYFINRHVGKGVYELRNAHDKILKKKVNIKD